MYDAETFFVVGPIDGRAAERLPLAGLRCFAVSDGTTSAQRDAIQPCVISLGVICVSSSRSVE